MFSGSILKNCSKQRHNIALNLANLIITCCEVNPPAKPDKLSSTLMGLKEIESDFILFCNSIRKAN